MVYTSTHYVQQFLNFEWRKTETKSDQSRLSRDSNPGPSQLLRNNRNSFSTTTFYRLPKNVNQRKSVLDHGLRSIAS